MGRFFNEKVMELKRIPRGLIKNSPLEKARKDFNMKNQGVPELSLADRRRQNIAKARMVKQAKRNKGNA